MKTDNYNILSKVLSHYWKVDQLTDYEIHQIIRSFDDQFLKYYYYSDDISFFSMIGVDVAFLNPDIAIIKKNHGFLQTLDVGDIILRVNDQSLFEFCSKTFRESEEYKLTFVKNVSGLNSSIEELKFHLPEFRNVSKSEFFEFYQNESIGVLKIGNFSLTTIIEACKKINMLHRNNIETLIIDLRSNMGGSVENAKLLLENFFEKGTELFQLCHPKKKIMKIYAENEGFFSFNRIIILIDQLTMSSAELFSIIMCEKLNSVILGENSYGKGVACTNISIDDERRMTIPAYLIKTELNSVFNEVGVPPNIHFEWSQTELNFTNITDYLKLLEVNNLL